MTKPILSNQSVLKSRPQFWHLATTDMIVIIKWSSKNSMHSRYLQQTAQAVFVSWKSQFMNEGEMQCNETTFLWSTNLLLIYCSDTLLPCTPSSLAHNNRGKTIELATDMPISTAYKVLRVDVTVDNKRCLQKELHYEQSMWVFLTKTRLLCTCVLLEILHMRRPIYNYNYRLVCEYLLDVLPTNCLSSFEPP